MSLADLILNTQYLTTCLKRGCVVIIVVRRCFKNGEYSLDGRIRGVGFITGIPSFGKMMVSQLCCWVDG